jgi:toxin ParE1/3/4
VTASSRIVWSASAVRDLTDIAAFIARTSPRYASLVTQRLIAAVGRLEQFPESGRVVPELAEPRVREVIHGSYRIVYELRDSRVEILTVFRASRRFPQADTE